MVYILEANIPDNKSVLFALKFIYGIGKNKSYKLCKHLGFSPNLNLKQLSKEQINRLTKTVELLNFKTSSDLKKLKAIKKNKLIRIKSYRGLRKTLGLPIRGQRTHTNAKTAKRVH
jgi:small subunit ribosomal protein S13